MENKRTKEEDEQLLDAFMEMVQMLQRPVKKWESEREKRRTLLKANYNNVGKIITYHLVIENQVNLELYRCFRLTEEKLERLRLRFSQKLEMLPATLPFFDFIIKGIKELNYIRNKIAHNLNKEIKIDMIPEISFVVNTLNYKGVAHLSVEERIEYFTIYCLGFFSLNDGKVVVAWQKYEKKYPEFAQLLKQGLVKNLNSEKLKPK